MMMRGLMLLLFSTAATASSSRESDQPVRVFILMGQSNMGVSAFCRGVSAVFQIPQDLDTMFASCLRSPARLPPAFFY